MSIAAVSGLIESYPHARFTQQRSQVQGVRCNPRRVPRPIVARPGRNAYCDRASTLLGLACLLCIHLVL